MQDKHTIYLILIAITVTAILTATATWTATQQPRDTVQIKIGLTPLNIYPIRINDWVIQVNLCGVYNTVTEIKSDLYTATKDGTQLQADTLYNIIQKIMEHDGTLPTF